MTARVAAQRNEKRTAMSSVRIAAWAAILTLLPAIGALAKPIDTTADTNLRKSPGTNSLILTLIPKGTSIEVGKCSNGWCPVSLNGQDGYVIAQNVGMATARRAPRGPMVTEEIVDEEYGPPVIYRPAPYVVGPPVFAGFGFYGGWGYRHGWGRRW
jgi:uncharacterized protein YraI